MSNRVVVPVPSFLPKSDANRLNEPSTSNKVTTVLTNLQRRNVQTVKIDKQAPLSIFQMAAQGELIQLQAKLDILGVDIDERDNKVGCDYYINVIICLLLELQNNFVLKVITSLLMRDIFCYYCRASPLYYGHARMVKSRWWNCYFIGVRMPMFVV